VCGRYYLFFYDFKNLSRRSTVAPRPDEAGAVASVAPTRYNALYNGGGVCGHRINTTCMPPTTYRYHIIDDNNNPTKTRLVERRFNNNGDVGNTTRR